ncbi:MAG: hypothetical protein QOC81_3919 [Thermoanaerobaculia bacterium]|nr:hypothetical protein [Thermoanaerobaculia bacterium]
MPPFEECAGVSFSLPESLAVFEQLVETTNGKIPLYVSLLGAAFAEAETALLRTIFLVLGHVEGFELRGRDRVLVGVVARI